MPSKFRIRNLFKGKLVNIIAKKFANINVKPNHVTLIGPIFAIIAVILFYFGGVIIGSILFGITIFIIMLFDGVDGALARLTGSQSNFGGFFDSTMDRYTDFILIFGFIVFYDPNLMSDSNFNYYLPLYIWVIITIIGILLTSYSRSLAEKVGLEDTDIGLFGRSERLLVLTISSWILLPILGLIFLAIFSNLTALFRIISYGVKINKIE
ncbi:MAG: CDP-alcohol phosphatidyltransferase family protein [Candidatus Helarchaeota archaeon]|nr:CDP-alcohol phosphatidyltransferase family protein [Candidatus Helarchaeota archaeon]